MARELPLEKHVVETAARREGGCLAVLYRERLKRPFDILGALALLVLAAPLIGGLLVLVARDGAAPLFGHRRVGLRGKTFLCLKIRTMVPDAEARLTEILRDDPLRAEEWARDHKLEDDPRITPIGAFLRRTSLDELPQLINVLWGDMSLVGPRPVTSEELVERYGVHAEDYKTVRPGLTGLWQVTGRNALSYGERVALDRRYAQDVTFGGDLKTLVATGRVLVTGDGR